MVTGISIGSINGFMVSIHKKGNETKMIEWMEDLWSSLDSDDLFENWPYGIGEGILFRPGLFNNKPGV